MCELSHRQGLWATLKGVKGRTRIQRASGRALHIKLLAAPASDEETQLRHPQLQQDVLVGASQAWEGVHVSVGP